MAPPLFSWPNLCQRPSATLALLEPATETEEKQNEKKQTETHVEVAAFGSCHPTSPP